MMKRVMMAAVVALGSLVGAGHALAVTGDINATANVLTPLTVGGTNSDLAFGDVFPGVNKTVLFSDATAGYWDVSGYGGAEVSLAFTLPANLMNGATPMAIDFTGNTAGVHSADLGSGSQASATGFDPSAAST